LREVLEPWNSLGFCFVFDHLHAAVATDRAGAGAAAHAIECSIGWFRRPAGSGPQRETWNPPRFKPMEDQRHVRNAVPYILRNGSKSTGTEPLLWRWSPAWDILGLRASDAVFAAGFDAITPSGVALALTGDAGWRPSPARKLESPAESVELLWKSATASLGYLGDPGAMAMFTRATARLVTVHLGRHRGWDPAKMANALGIQPRSANRLATLEVDPALLAAASRVLGLVDQGFPAKEVFREMPADPVPQDLAHAHTQKPAERADYPRRGR
jgi:hypothetical protein